MPKPNQKLVRSCGWCSTMKYGDVLIRYEGSGSSHLICWKLAWYVYRCSQKYVGQQVDAQEDKAPGVCTVPSDKLRYSQSRAVQEGKAASFLNISVHKQTYSI